MKVPMSWLREYVDIDCDIKTFEHAITMSGSKVESVEEKGKEIEDIIVGKLLKVKKHPAADKLLVAKVDVGWERTLNICTGADNIFEGAYVPIAVDGSTISGGKKIKTGKLRGEVSEGMMCSIEELGYTIQDYPECAEDSIYIFDREYPLGADVRPILELREDIVEFEITSNRPDCFSIVGIAREAAATFDKPLKLPEISVKEEAGGDINEKIAVEIKNPELCLRYAARLVQDVKIGPSPQWLRHRLTTAGIRPINNIVDITNYVMLELGQPMHAFDLDTIDESKIIVRTANDGDLFTTLDGTQRKLDSQMLMITDCNKYVGIAGVMGGENSKITGGAGAILLESANFYGPNIRVTAKKLGLRTDASGKYEKGLDPELCLDAVNRAAQLIEQLGCGKVVKGVVDCYPEKRMPRKVTYSPQRINMLLGTDIAAEDMEKYLSRLGIPAANGVAEIPTFRPDITMTEDIAEEVARLYGYGNIKSTLAAGTPTVGKKNRKQTIEDIIKDFCVSCGFYECLNYSFESPRVLEKLCVPEDDERFADIRNLLRITNPLGEDFSVMRTTTLNGMLQSLSTNYNRRNPKAALFEVAKVYRPKSLPATEQPDELETLTLGLYGGGDFFDLKGVVEQLFKVLGLTKKISFTKQEDLPFMHPGRAADITTADGPVGYIGEIHPMVAENYELGAKTYVAVIQGDWLYENADLSRKFTPLPKFPAVSRDIAMLVKEDVPVGDIESAIRERGGKLLDELKLFDVYKGKQIEEGFKSVAYSISFRSADKTLTDVDVSKAMHKILLNLEGKFGAQMRDK